jgi:N-sulfoglucosamine sulfohydrolase
MKKIFLLKKYLLILLLVPLFSSKQNEPAATKNQVAKRPNILFCIADDASFQHMSAYGLNDWVKTPNFDRVAKGGLLFKNAYTPNAKCAPSRAMILTGRNLWQLEEAGNHVPYFPAKFTSFMEALGKNGYQTGYTGKGWAPGVAKDAKGQNRQLTGPAFNEIKMATPTNAISPVNYTANFEAFLNKKNQTEPFCFWYGGHEPHRVYEYGSGVAKGQKKLADIDKVPGYWPDNETVRNDMLDYAYEVEYFDKHLGLMLDLLEKRGELENTIIVVTSDNGMPFPRVKGHVYEFANHLPLAIMWPKGIKIPNRKIQDFVSFIDFTPTFLEIAGVSPAKGNMQPVQGKSLVPIFNSSKDGQVDPARNYVLLGRERNDVGRPNDAGYPVRAIVKGNFIYSRNYEPSRWPTGNPETGYMDTDGSPTKTNILNSKRDGSNAKYWDLSFGKRPAEELYQLDKDPFALTNQAGNAAFTQVKNGLKLQMEKELKNQGDPRMNGKGYLYDQYPYAEEKVRNFYERFTKGEKIKANWINETDFEKDQAK